MNQPSYDLHLLGWKSFQDLCIAVSEECLQRPVQMFLPGNDAGRDGAFIGRWQKPDEGGSSTIQCKFTSLPHEHLTLSLLEDELAKVSALATKGLAADYVILTNHPVSGAAEIKIKEAFESAGVGACRVFGKDWIVGQIQKSARLRMMVPRIYGLGDLGNILDGRAYEQASMILSAMGDDLKRLVVTDAHRKSVRAISDHNFVLLLGAPAAGKSTIGASLAVGAADLWKSMTIKATSPQDVIDHVNPNERQFFWIDDAWGSTQYQRQTVEAWNQALPLIQSAIHRGSQFLLTSRDYIWRAAINDLKTQSLPLLNRSQVVINVQALSPDERAQILYNHIRLGDQPRSFRTAIKDILPDIAASNHFLPETARRLGSTFFTGAVEPTREAVLRLFEHPAGFLQDTIRNLSNDCRAAIALIFLNGGRIASPVPEGQEMQLAASAFGVSAAATREALNALNGSLVLLAHDEQGRYWTYKHPTIGDAFATLVANDSELTEIYLRGAKPDYILREVVCTGVSLQGASVCVPKALYPLLLERLSTRHSYELAGFLSYRADAPFASMILSKRPDVFQRLHSFSTPISEDSDASLLARLWKFGLVTEELRSSFVNRVRRGVLEDADASFLDDFEIRNVLTDEEVTDILNQVRQEVLPNIDSYVDNYRDAWDREYSPEDQFDQLKNFVDTFVRELDGPEKHRATLVHLSLSIDKAVREMEDEYQPAAKSSAPTAAKSHVDSPLAQIFRDVDQ